MPLFDRRFRFGAWIWLLFSGLSACGSCPEAGEIIRSPAAAGTFYPQSAEALRAMINRFRDRDIPDDALEQPPDTGGPAEILAAVAPHAGYAYSGSVAFAVHRLLARTDPDTVVIIGHDTGSPGHVAFTCPADFFETPLGTVAVDTDMIARLHAFHPGIQPNPAIHNRDHTVEVHLPFLQVLGARCKIVPILFGRPTAENCKILADAILSAAGEKRVFVLASTDLSHYPPYGAAGTLDRKTLRMVLALDPEMLFRYLEKEEERDDIRNLDTAMCSRGGVGTAMFFAKAGGANKARILKYANSGDAGIGDKTRVVGYGAVIIWKDLPIKSSDTRQYPESAGSPWP